ncbi:MAG: MBL fold metallo-hydrolase [Clostridia bacterium]|nr:MBL fold metallo-hydrolase [Clostridia bacterium]
MNIELIAQNAIRIVMESGKVIYFDPFKLNGKYLKDADIIFITHSHFDHFSPEDIEKIKNNHTRIVVTNDLVEKSIQCGFEETNILKVSPNNEYDYDGIKFKTIPAYNINKEFHKREYDWVSYILEIEDSMVYVAGDTDITEEALNVQCDIAFVPVGGTYTMTAEEAAKLIVHISPKKYAVPTHYKTVVGSVNDAIKFKSLLEGKVEVDILMK